MRTEGSCGREIRLESIRVHGELRPPGARPSGRSCRANEVRKGISHRFPRTGSHPSELRIGKPAPRGPQMERGRVASQIPPRRTVALLIHQHATSADEG